MKNLLFTLLALAALIRPAGAIEWKIQEPHGASKKYSAKGSSVATHTVTGVLMSWSVKAKGGTVDFVVKHSTNILDASPNFDINVSSTMFLNDGDFINENEKGVVYNPMIVITRIDAATTAYVLIDYLAPREPGDL